MARPSKLPKGRDGEAVEQRALECLARGELEQAVGELQDMVATAGKTSRHYVLLGEARRLAGEPDRALEDFRMALAAPGSEQLAGAAYYSRGLCFMSLGEWYAAAEAFMQSAPGGDLPAEALVSIGTCARRLGDTERALQLFSKALQLEPEHSHARMCRAELQEIAGNTVSAADDYKHLLRTDPNFSAVYLREAYVAVANGLLQETAAVCDGMLRLLAHADESAPDYAYIQAQRTQFESLKQNSVQQH